MTSGSSGFLPFRREGAGGHQSTNEFPSQIRAEWTDSPASEDTPSTSESLTDVEGNPVLAKKENIAVKNSKRLVFAALIVAATGVCLAVWFFLNAEETDGFETQFTNFATEILDSAESNAEDFLGKLQSVSRTLTSYSADTERIWPNTTLPNFDIRTTDSFEKLAGAELYIFAPVVKPSERRGFEKYAWERQGWIEEDLELRGLGKIKPGKIPRRVYSFTGEYEEETLESRIYVPIWQVSPVPTNADIIMLDLYSHPSFQRMIDDCIDVQHILLSEVVDRTFLSDNIETLDQDPDRDHHPRSYAIQPIFQAFESDAELVGFIFAIVPWDSYFVDVLPPGTDGFVVVVEDTCGSSFAYRLDGPEATLLASDFRPNPEYSHLAQSAEFAQFARFDGQVANDFVTHCSYRIVVHPHDDLAREYDTKTPILYTSIIFVVFFFTTMVFVMYDFYVQRRQDKVLMTAKKTSAIVSSLFPKNVQKRIMADAAAEIGASFARRKTFSGKDMLKNFLGHGSHEQGGSYAYQTKPIADFFPETTIMFADIVGFTAWSSTREPSQVFTLLETIYHEFDQSARHRRVFKVETVGDCYVAVAGLPDPCKDHAIVMARFARECLYQLMNLTKRLEVSLGPDTADLGMRVGLHTGPVTAGVLRGERSRFQLFGDTMNTASRMESTGRRNKIQVSQEVAEFLKKAGKSDWIRPRHDLIFVKGKGEMQSFWLEFEGENEDPSGAIVYEDHTDFTMSESSDSFLKGSTGSGRSFSLSSLGSVEAITLPTRRKLNDKILRLVNWNVDLMAGLLKEIISRRHATRTKPDSDEALLELEDSVLDQTENVLSEVKEIITMPGFRVTEKSFDPNAIKLEEKVMVQLRSYVEEIAQMYHDNPFHSFEHASHVTMSVVKLFSRIIAPDMEHIGNNSTERTLHDHTYGITSDPLTQLAVIVSAMVHDADHQGVPNSQLVKERAPMAAGYNNKSVAEQNSIDLAWELLMRDEYTDMRRLIYATEPEFHRFRSLMVNTVLATDIMDKDLKVLRNNRWDKAFADNTVNAESPMDAVNRKATVVIEHLIQASDVSHTMQHWHIYRKWNARLFEEMYRAFIEGRAEKDPSEFWYKGELGFLDFYVIPLAKKLKDCGVFGVSSDEYLQYALNNRSEWERKGQEVLQELIAGVSHIKKWDQQRKLKQYNDTKDAAGRNSA